MTSHQRKIKGLCQKFYDDLQAVFDDMSDDPNFDTSLYECNAVQDAVSAQTSAEDVINADPEDWK